MSPRQIDALAPPPPSERREMKVLCLSAPRSGSTSMGQALTKLGYRPFAGMAHNYFHDNRFDIWTEAINASYNGIGPRFKRADFDKFLGSYDAVSGWPAAILADDLMRAYPEAKVILTRREPDEWLESWNDTVVATHRWWQKWRWILPICGGLERDFRKNAEVSLYAWSYGDPFDRGQQRQLYTDHYEKVRQLVPGHLLLDMSAAGNWKELCGFLDKDEPKGPYPHGAGRDGFHAAMMMFWKRALFRAAKRLAVVFGTMSLVAILVARYWRGRQNLSFL